MATRAKKAAVSLTQREQEVLTLLADGYSNEEAGQILGLSRRTIEAHRARIMLKLNLHTLPALVKYSIQNGLVSVDKHRSDPRMPE
ncbi:MAG: response regulator transcription factor [Blastocatellia bacterium]|jgi:two-component system, NarL family, response regulator NreC|nr:response regulator transcription factor [Blastocatellia bacterium]MBL8194768.1 response regulator transcription factor [Blastocatellia bacterium]MBN8722512.1 response regulator transcription factor [Acidobacteriota bacterium]